VSGSASAINVHIRTPDSSLDARRRLIVSFTTCGARRPYQARHTRAYIDAACSSVTRIRASGIYDEHMTDGAYLPTEKMQSSVEVVKFFVHNWSRLLARQFLRLGSNVPRLIRGFLSWRLLIEPMLIRAGRAASLRRNAGLGWRCSQAGRSYDETLYHPGGPTCRV
jgi:hypothetical protein